MQGDAAHQPAALAADLTKSLAVAVPVTRHLPSVDAGILVSFATHAFAHGLDGAIVIGAATAAVAAILAAVFLPAHEAVRVEADVSPRPKKAEA